MSNTVVRIPVMIDDSAFETDEEPDADPGADQGPLTDYEIRHPELQQPKVKSGQQDEQ